MRNERSSLDFGSLAESSSRAIFRGTPALLKLETTPGFAKFVHSTEHAGGSHGASRSHQASTLSESDGVPRHGNSR